MLGFSYNPVDLIELSTPQGGGIYLGNYQAMQNAHTLGEPRVVAVLSAIPSLIASMPHFSQYGITQKIIECMDDPSFDMTPYLDTAADFINENLKRGTVLVNCAAGISRSTTCLCAYYIKHRGMNLEAALALIRRSRPIAAPNTGFLQQLRIFENRVRGNLSY